MLLPLGIEYFWSATGGTLRYGKVVSGEGGTLHFGETVLGEGGTLRSGKTSSGEEGDTSLRRNLFRGRRGRNYPPTLREGGNSYPDELPLALRVFRARVFFSGSLFSSSPQGRGVEAATLSSL